MDKIINIVSDWEKYLENCKDRFYFYNVDIYKYPHCMLKDACIENTYIFLRKKLKRDNCKVLYIWRPNLW